MKYLLVAFGKFTGKSNLVRNLAESVSIISEKEDVKYSYGDQLLIIKFQCSDEQDDVDLFINDLFIDVTSLYLLVPFTENVYTSLPMDLHKYIFGMSENQNDDNYDIEDEAIISQLSPKQDLKKQKINGENQIKDLSLDDILDKINEKGVSSLSEQEKSILKKYSN
jgi:hypothetical protein